MGKIKRAVSLYSLQHEYATGKAGLQDIFFYLKELGVDGFEFISDQMMHNAPYPTAEQLRNWDKMMETYQITPVCNDIFIDTKLYKNRVLTKREAVSDLIDEIKLANRLGFKMVRLVSMTPPEIIEPVLPYAVEYDVTLALEIHGGMSFDNPWTKGFIDVMKELDSPFLGLVLDLGIFCRRHPRISREYFLGLGLNRAVADYIDDIFAAGSDPLRTFGSASNFPSDLTKHFKSEIDFQYAIFSTGYENSPLNILDQYMPYIKHIHGKFYEITEHGEEYSIPYCEIIDYLQQHNYDGYIASEYEGQRFTPDELPIDSFNAVRQHQEMLKRYISESK